MGKKNKHRPRSSNSPVIAPSGSAVGTSPVAAQQTPEAALDVIKAGHAAALNGATEEDLEAAISAPATSTSVDVVAAAKLVQEALALCSARDSHLTRLDAELRERERRANDRDAATKDRESALASFEQELQRERRRLEELTARTQNAHQEFLAREESLRERELNAEAGFAAERRKSLLQLEAEAATLRDDLSRARTQIANERAEWDARWRAEAERIREEHRQAVDSQRAALTEAERASCEQRRLELETLARERAALKKTLAQLEIDREILQEDRDAFDVRVDRKAAALLEEAMAMRQALEARLTRARSDRDALDRELRRRDEAQRVLGNRPLEDVKQDLDALTRERDALKSQLASRPHHDVAARLESLERAQEEWEGERARLTQECMAAKAALARSSIAVTEIETLRDQKAALESGRDLLHAALEELRKDVDERIRRADGVSPFPSCSQMDTDSALQTKTPVLDDIADLAAFARDLQQRIAHDPDTNKVLYYSLPDIRCFLGGLAMSRLHLLHGISGTGKTSLPLAVARALGAGSTLVEVQAGWRDRQDLIGHFNAFERRFYEAEFLQALYRAQCPGYSDRIYIIVLDEMNLSHPEQYFADLLSALEQDPDRQKLELMTAPVDPAPALLRNGRTLAIPPNVWFVGTANHDETTKDFADKTYDRAHVMELPRQREVFKPQRMPPRLPVSLTALRKTFGKARAAHEKDAEKAYRFLDEAFADVLDRRFRVGWGNRLERQLLDFVPVVVAAGGSVGEAVDHILATKLLRKIRDRHDTRPDDLDALANTLKEKWPLLDAKAPAAKSLAIIDDERRRLGVEEET